MHSLGGYGMNARGRTESLNQTDQTTNPRFLQTMLSSHCVLTSIRKKSFFDNKQSKNITVSQKNDRPIFLEVPHTKFLATSLSTLEKLNVLGVFLLISGKDHHKQEHVVTVCPSDPCISHP